MAGDIILGTTDLVINTTGGSPVVADTSFIQPISAVEFIFTRVSGMFESSRVPNISRFRLCLTIHCVVIVMFLSWQNRRSLYSNISYGIGHVLALPAFAVC